MALSRLAVSCIFAAEAALTLVFIGYADRRDLAATAADRPSATSDGPGGTQAAASLPALTKISAAGVTLQSVRVDIPDRGMTFPGSGSDAINNNCLVCHSAGMVLNQPALPKAAWQAEVDKMIHAYKAPVAPEDVAAIIDYLARVKGGN
jgi:cytochrome c5